MFQICDICGSMFYDPDGQYCVDCQEGKNKRLKERLYELSKTSNNEP